MTHLERLGQFVATLEAAALPADVVRAARYQILDMIAAAHGAAASPEVAAAAHAVGDFAGPGRATVLATGQRMGCADAALGNALCSMGHDFDDILWMGHTCHSAVFAALAVAEAEGKASGDELLAAVVAANEVAGRLGASTILGPLNGQMVTHIHLVGAAAAAARLLHLDAARTAHALAISLAQPSFPLQPAFMAPTSKLLSAATPTATGVQAAYFARAGMTGAAALLEDRRGFWRRFAFLPLPSMLDGLGELWVLRTLTLKNYPGCHFFQTACSALDEILARTGPLSTDRIARVRLATTKLAAEVNRFGNAYAPPEGPVTAVNVNFNLAVTCAVHLLAGRLTPAELDPAWLAERSDDIRRLAARIDVRHEPELTAKVLQGARAIAAGRRALADLGAGDLLRLVRRYREEYASSLLSAEELLGWLKLVGRLFRPSAPPPSGAAVPLFFPSRVVVELQDGRREEARVDLPAGSVAAPGVEAELERKFLRETARTLGEAGGRAAFGAGLALGGGSLSRFFELVSAPRSG